MSSAGHARLMDATYRYQRHVYDATRRYYLLGRDELIEKLEPPAGGSVLELACGTGRNLARVAKVHPGCRLYGMDISAEMLRSARGNLPRGVALAQGDACSFSGAAAFGVGRFDRIVLSYSLSMIPDWQGTIQNAVRQLADGGELHVVDFGEQMDFPRWFRKGLHAWLARFHVTPRRDLAERLADAAARAGAVLRVRSIYGDYARYAVVSKTRRWEAAVPGQPVRERVAEPVARVVVAPGLI